MILELCGSDDDMQDALATVHIEHLLEEDFDDALRRVKLHLVDGTAGFVGLLGRCWRFGQPEAKWREFQDVVESAAVEGALGTAGGVGCAIRRKCILAPTVFREKSGRSPASRVARQPSEPFHDHA